jgi:hypothetical protein
MHTCGVYCDTIFVDMEVLSLVLSGCYKSKFACAHPILRKVWQFSLDFWLQNDLNNAEEYVSFIPANYLGRYFTVWYACDSRLGAWP